MTVLTLPEVKAHLRVDHDAEDVLISGMIDAAEDYVSRYLERPLPWEDEDGRPVPVPAAVRAAILLIVGDLYAHREAQFVGTSHAENPAVMRLLAPYRTNMGV